MPVRADPGRARWPRFVNRGPGSRRGHRDDGLSSAERCIQGSRGCGSDAVPRRAQQRDLTKSDDLWLRIRGHFRTLLRPSLVNSSRRSGYSGAPRQSRRSRHLKVRPLANSRDRPAMLLLPPREPLSGAFTLEAGTGPAEPLFVASTWTKVTTGPEAGAQRAHHRGGWIRSRYNAGPRHEAIARGRGLVLFVIRGDFSGKAHGTVRRIGRAPASSWWLQASQRTEEPGP